MTTVNDNYRTFYLIFRDPWLKVIPHFNYMIKQNGVIISDSCVNQSGKTAPLITDINKSMQVYAKESWKENSPVVYLETIMSFKDFYEKNGKYLLVIYIDVPYLRFDLKTVKISREKGNYKRKTYKINSGDTLDEIALKFGVKAADILKINSKIKDKNLIYAGEVIKIPTKV